MPYWAKTIGAEGETRTRTDIRPLPPQGSVSTNFTTSALTFALTLRDFGVFVTKVVGDFTFS